MSKTIGIVGTRRRDGRDDLLSVARKFQEVYTPGDTICSGYCPRGGDRFAVKLSELYKTPTLWFPADWKKYGRGAGFVRNTDIAFRSDILIACVAPDRKGGTEDTIRKFIRFHGSENLYIV